MAKMNPEVKSKWLELLRSGKYEQGSGQLAQFARIEVDEDRNEEYIPLKTPRYCCLGVLCLVEGSPEQVSAKEMPNSTTLDWAGIPWSYSTYDGRKTHILEGPAQSLADKNNKGKTFEEIADWIEENL